MKKTTLLATLVALPTALTGCTTEGTAIGEVESPAGTPEGTVTLTWESDFADPISGTISGTMPDGQFYTGSYYEITATAVEDDYAGAWAGWGDYWTDWPVTYDYGYGGTWPEFVTIYSGRVVANLMAADGSRLRCRFTLADPTEGLEGGGSGECQTSDGEQINNVVVMPE